jgi:hypothetical protein
MADWDSADLLARVKALTDSPTLDNSMTDAKWYTLLSNAQQRMYRVVASHVPEVLVGAPLALSTADGGYTYTFANSVVPMGLAEVRHGTTGEILIPGAAFSDYADFVWEGATIRMPNGTHRTFANGLYARYVAPPSAISATVQPTLLPADARILLVYSAADEWATMFGRDPAPYARMCQKELFGDPMMPGDVGIIGRLKQSVFGRGADAGTPASVYWWRQGDWVR